MTIPSIEYRVCDERDLDLIKDLWHSLNQHHIDRTSAFKSQYEAKTFEQRKQELIEKAAHGSCHLHVAVDGACRKLVGYCVSCVIPKLKGAVESLYIDPAYRQHGIGKVFMEKALTWMDTHYVLRKQIAVYVGNEEVLSFYAQHGFKPRYIILEQELS